MTNRQLADLLKSCRGDLRRTLEGYVTHPNGTYWRVAMPKLDKAIAELERPKVVVPNLGPIRAGGKPVLLQDCTHLTAVLNWPALDDLAAPGTSVLAPEDCVVYDNTSGAQGGDAFYIRGASGILFWVGHISSVPVQGRRFKRGAVMTKISAQHPRPHVHLGIDARPLIGKHLISHTNYTHGAPLIGVQLTKALAV